MQIESNMTCDRVSRRNRITQTLDNKRRVSAHRTAVNQSKVNKVSKPSFEID